MPSSEVSMTAEKVLFFRSVDGVLHETEAACLARNFALKSRPRIKESLTSNAEFISDAPGQMTVDAVCDWLVKCTPEILAILTPLVTPIDPPVRRRRTKAEIALEKAAQAVLQAQSGAKPSDEAKPQTLEQFAAKEAGLLASAGDVNANAADDFAMSGEGEEVGTDAGSGFPD